MVYNNHDTNIDNHNLTNNSNARAFSDLSFIVPSLTWRRPGQQAKVRFQGLGLGDVVSDAVDGMLHGYNPNT